MSHHNYWSYDAQEAHKQGHRDELYSRMNYDFDRYSSDERDRAYFEGREDERREEERRREEREQERMEEERHHQAMITQSEMDRAYEAAMYEAEYPEEPLPTPEQVEEENGLINEETK